MEVVASKSLGRVRVRVDGASRQPDRQVFRIEDEDGRLLRRVRDARHPQEAVALYWRAVGAATPGATMSKDLERRIGRARARMARSALQTEELPFEAAPEPAAGDTVAADPAAQDAAPVRRTHLRPAPTPQDDLFEAVETAAPDDPVDEDPVDDDPADHEAADPEPAASTPAASTPAAQTLPAPASSADPEPRLLDPHDVLLQRIDPRNLRATDRADAYLYHVTNGPDAELALKQGLLVSTSDPMILTERQGVGYWLSVLAEDYDYILDGPADFVVLRLRRMTVEELLEPDPHASRSAGCPCYLLTGRG